MDEHMDHFDRVDGVETDLFERRLTVLMRDGEQYAPFEPWHRDRLRAGVRARRRARAARRVLGSALTVAGLALGLLVLPGRHVRDEPGAPVPRPVPAPSSSPAPPAPPVTLSSVTPSYPPDPSASPPGTGAPTGPSASGTLPGDPTTAPPPSTSPPATAPVTRNPPGPGTTLTAPPPSRTGTSLAGPSGRSAP